MKTEFACSRFTTCTNEPVEKKPKGKKGRPTKSNANGEAGKSSTTDEEVNIFNYTSQVILPINFFSFGMGHLFNMTLIDVEHSALLQELQTNIGRFDAKHYG